MVVHEAVAVLAIVYVDRGSSGFGFAMVDKTGHEVAAPEDEVADTEAPASAVELQAVAENRFEPGVVAEIDYMGGLEMEVLDPEPAFEVASDPLTELGAVHWQLIVHLFAVEVVQFEIELGAAAVAGAEHEAALVVEPEVGVVSELDQKPGELDHKPEEDNLA